MQDVPIKAEPAGDPTVTAALHSYNAALHSYNATSHMFKLPAGCDLLHLSDVLDTG